MRSLTPKVGGRVDVAEGFVDGLSWSARGGLFPWCRGLGALGCVRAMARTPSDLRLFFSVILRCS